MVESVTAKVTPVTAASNVVPGASLPGTAVPAMLECRLPWGGVNGGCATERWCELPVVISIARHERVVGQFPGFKNRQVGQTSSLGGTMLAELLSAGYRCANRQTKSGERWRPYWEPRGSYFSP